MVPKCLYTLDRRFLTELRRGERGGQDDDALIRRMRKIG